MKADVTLKSSVEEASVIIEALQFYRLVRSADAHSKHLSDEERLECGRTVLRIEIILRGFGAEPHELPKEDE